MLPPHHRDSFAAVESVKAANDVYSPVTCTVTDINEELGDEPGIVNDSPEENGWLMKAKVRSATKQCTPRYNPFSHPPTTTAWQHF